MIDELLGLPESLGKKLQAQGLKIAAAESCTGGGVCQLITEVAGSSQWFDRGFITYSNQSKIEILGVKAETLERYGAVSAEVALEMAQGALDNSDADCAIAITGIAGPSGGSLDKPVGTVFIAQIIKNQACECNKYLFDGDRLKIREQAMFYALSLD